MPRFKSIIFDQNRLQIKLLLQKNCKISKWNGLQPQIFLPPGFMGAAS